MTAPTHRKRESLCDIGLRSQTNRKIIPRTRTRRELRSPGAICDRGHSHLTNPTHHSLWFVRSWKINCPPARNVTRETRRASG